jgi:hypothetical protein
MTKKEESVVNDEVKKGMGKKYMFFIGAGFSVPAGLPKASDLNSGILKADKLPITFHTDGELHEGINDLSIQSLHDEAFQVGIKIIQRYSYIHGNFDYEEFYEYLFDIFHRSLKREQDEELQEMYPFFKNTFGSPDGLMLHLRINQFMYLYPKLVHYLIRKSNKEEQEAKNYVIEYKKYMDYMKALVDAGNVVEIYSLNHDTILEELMASYELSESFCDGFSRVGSPFYENQIALERFTNKYDKPIRLHKLHGSTSYYAFAVETKPSHFDVVNLIKSDYHLNEESLLYVENNSQYKFTKAMLGLEAEFLTGTKSKAKRYDAPIYYKPQFENFERDLMSTDNVFVIGYGFKDERVNEIIKQKVNKEARCRVVDPYINESAINKAGDVLPNVRIIKESITDMDWP